jgi:hypothetical protein
MISLPPAFSMKVSCDQSAGTMASSAPASMKIAPETVLQCASLARFFADDKTGAADHGHACAPVEVKTTWEK